LFADAQEETTEKKVLKILKKVLKEGIESFTAT
jgi:hypothetical protein